MMSVSNVLTYDEWNACYFLGLLHGGREVSPEEQLKIGLIALQRAGYQFTNPMPPIEDCELTEIKNMEFPLPEVRLARAKEFLIWVDAHPNLKFNPNHIGQLRATVNES